MFPWVDLSGGAARTHQLDRDPRDPFSGRAGSSTRITHTDRYFVSTGLSYEIDVWKRIAARRRAATLEYQASRQDLEASALLLTGSVVDVWFILQEQKALLALLQEQIEISQELLDLTEVRFGVGAGSAVDVSSSASSWRLPEPKSRLSAHASTPPTTSWPCCSAPRRGRWIPYPGRRSAGPAAVSAAGRAGHPAGVAAGPALHPVALAGCGFSGRHRSRRAAAAAGTRPVLRDSAPAAFRPSSARRSASLVGNLVAPVIDGGLRRNQVVRHKALTQELLDRFGQQYLQALLEIEDALVRERFRSN